MAEKTLRSVDPLAYHVNNVTDLDKEVVLAYKGKDTKTLKHILAGDKTDFDVFICVNNAYHAFVLCAANQTVDDDLGLFPEMSGDPFDMPNLLMVHQFELCFESEQLRTYKLRKRFELFKDVKNRIHRAYYIGRYKNVVVRAFQLAALAASPTRYSVFLEDCVEFAKEFCIRLLSYCSNWKTLEKEVESQIRKATATGLSVEALSRRIQSSAKIMNLFLGGADGTSLIGNRYPLSLPAFIALFFLIYPVFVALFVKWYA